MMKGGRAVDAGPGREGEALRTRSGVEDEERSLSAAGEDEPLGEDGLGRHVAPLGVEGPQHRAAPGVERGDLSVRRPHEDLAAADEGGRRDGVTDVRLPLRDHALDPDALDGAVPAGEVDVGAVGSRGVDRAARTAAPQALAVRGADGAEDAPLLAQQDEPGGEGWGAAQLQLGVIGSKGPAVDR